MLRGNLRVALSEAFYMKFIEDGLMPGGGGSPILSPFKSGIHHGGEGSKCGIIARIKRKILFWIPYPIAEQHIFPLKIPADPLRVRIEKHFMRIKPMAHRWVIRSVNPIPIKLARADPWEIPMPNLATLSRESDTMRFSPRLGRFKKTDLHTRGMLGKDREVYPSAIPCSPKRKGAP